MICDALDVLCPMHAQVDATGRIVHAGPTLLKLLGDNIIGERFLEVLELYRPNRVTSQAELRELAGRRLHLRMRDADRTSLKGLAVAPQGTQTLIVNMSFGISVVDAVRRFTLTSADFASTDLAIEMLFLVEAKSAAMESSRKLNQRLQGAMIAAEEQAFTDTLTGLKNRRALNHVLSRMVEYETDFALVNLDLDFFKRVNDTMGHAAGDTVLLHVARALVEEIRESDTVARVGGDEFVLVFHNVTQRNRLAEISQRLISRLEEPIAFGSKTCRISCSIGIALSCEHPDADLETLFEYADVALYASKHAGRGQFTFYSEELREASQLQGINSVA